jgi:hypothetical protein
MHYGQRYDIRDVLLDHVTIAGRTVELRLVESQCAECGAEFSFWDDGSNDRAGVVQPTMQCPQTTGKTSS